LNEIVLEIREQGKGKAYDCILGVSGGLDSTYAAYVAKEHGLRPLLAHLDNGWDTEFSRKNIESLLKRFGSRLHTCVIDQEEYLDIQRAFLHAGTPDLEIPTDHAITAFLYREALKHGVNYIVSGANNVTELIMPATWSQGHSDWKYIRSVHGIHGKNGRPLKSFPRMPLLEFHKRRHIDGIRMVYVLNFVDYDRRKALDVLTREMDYVRYPYKHYESTYTRFVQGYILPERFGYDKRRAHLSNLIMTGEMTRGEAMDILETPPYPDQELLRKDMDLVKKRLGLSDEEFDRLMHLPKKRMRDYPCYENSVYYILFNKTLRMCKRLVGRPS
jgi:N-acetyl sugar amidotransferase